MKKTKLPFFYDKGICKKDRKFYFEYKKICEEHYNASDNIYYTFGYETFGIILLEFSKWLLDNVNKKGINKILFFSRDGKIMKRAFELLPETEKLDCDYIYVSRRSLRVPMLWYINQSRKTAICPTKYISIADLIDSLGLEPGKYIRKVKKRGLTLDTVIKDNDIENSKQIVGLLDDIWDEVLENSKREYEVLTTYISQFDMLGKIAVVDIGWRGSMQMLLEKFMESQNVNCKLSGYYITLSSNMYRGMDMYGYLNNVTGTGRGCDLLRGYVGLIELMFMCSEGSVLSYSTDRLEIAKPVLASSEYVGEQGYSMEMLAIEQLQNGALKFIEDFVQIYGSKKFNFSSTTTFANLNHFASNPSREALDMFGNFKFFNNGTVSYLAGKKKKDYPIYSLKQLKGELYESRWRTGFLKRTCKIKLPYDVIFKILMKIAM